MLQSFIIMTHALSLLTQASKIRKGVGMLQSFIIMTHALSLLTQASKIRKGV